MAIATATPVTQRVPMIKGKKPNSPLKGCHEFENSNSVKDLIARIGLDL